MIRRHSDLPLEYDSSNRFLPWMIAFMVYLAVLALAAAMVFGSAVSRWGAGLSGTLTIQVEYGPGAEAGIKKLVSLLEATEGVETVRVMTADETRALLEPWLGVGGTTGDLPIPRLIDVRLDDAVPVDVAALDRAVKAAVPGATVEDHRRWLADLIALVGSVEWLSAGIVLLTAISAMLTVVFAARTGLAVHHPVIELLHLVGARDRYVARQFQHHALMLGLRGGLIGLLLAAITLLGFAQFLQSLDNPVLPALTLSTVQWAILAALPFAAAIIAMYTARVTVLRALAKMP